jgi:penicillin-binding protein 2
MHRIGREVQRKRVFVPVVVKENLTWDQVSQIELNIPDLPGIAIEVGELRQYPFEDMTAHFLGYVGAVAEAELRSDPMKSDPVLALPGFRIGKAGVEKFHEGDLRGTAGTSELEVNAVGRVVRELAREEGEPGKEIQLTVDVGLQKFVQDRLKDQRSAAAVVMDVHTGGIFAMASNPSFDPNRFTLGIPLDLWQGLMADPASPLTNKVIAGQYCPGSTFKPVVALAALENGLINQHHTVFCPGYVELGDHKFYCYKHGGHGTLDLVGGIRESCDVFFYDLARRLGIDRIAEMARRMGLGQKLHLDLPGERPGLIPTRDWKLGTIGVAWTQGESLVAGIGQGYVLATPLQLAVMLSRIVNGGKEVQPHLTRQIGGQLLEPEILPSVGLQRANIDVVIEGMTAVVNSPHGTAYKARIMEPGMEMGGKSGSAQVRRISAAERATRVLKNDEIPWKLRDNALFMAFAPIRAPRYAVSVIVEHGGGGSVEAAPIARDILVECQKRDIGRPGARLSRSGAPPCCGEEHG